VAPPLSFAMMNFGLFIGCKGGELANPYEMHDKIQHKLH
jgi:hypothetical protein